MGRKLHLEEFMNYCEEIDKTWATEFRLSIPHFLANRKSKVKNIDVGSVVKSLHICKHCGVETFQPDEECYKAPKP